MSDGIPSPNPTYKQDIHNVSGDVEVVVGNKNICTNVTNRGLNNKAWLHFYFDKKMLQQTFTLSFTTNEALNGNSVYLYYGDSDSERVYIGEITAPANTRATKQITLSDSNYNLIKSASSYSIRVYKDGGNFNIPTDAQIENSATATTYVPHAQQTLPFTLASGQKMYLGDYLADDGIHHVRGEVVLDETSDIVSIQSNATTGNTTFVIRGVNGLKKGSYIAPLCNQLAGSSSSDYRNFKNQIVQWTDTSASFALGMDTSVVGTSKSNIQDYLENNPLIIEAFLAEEVIDPYTPTQQAQYNAIKKALSYKEQTNITLTSSDADPVTNVVAVADMSNMNNKLELMQAQIDLLS